MPDFEGECFVLCIRGTVHYHGKIAPLLLLRPTLACGKPSYSCKVSKFSLFVIIYVNPLNSDMQAWCVVFVESSVILSRERIITLCVCWLQVAMTRTHPKICLIVLLLLLGRRNAEE